MKDGIALYIHIPFCKQKCLYCDFASYSGAEKYMMEYIKALVLEIKKLGDKKIKTIFIGGGTPTYLSLEALKILKQYILELNLDDELEFTVEGNPGTFTRTKLQMFRAMGVNRLSIGLQSWQNKHLKTLGRIHKVEDFIKSFSMAREVGFDNINVDLMFGLPSQTFSDWQETLENVVELTPEHFSCYSLIIEEGTKFFEFEKNGKLNLPDEDTERKMYEYTIDFLNKKGYSQYEISNFSLNGKQCRHNLVYWNLEEYIGCGAAAHSYYGKIRYQNVESIEEYINLIKNNSSAVESKHTNSLEDEIEEFMFMGLRKTEGISIEKFNKKFKKSINEVYGDIIQKYKKENLLIEKDGRIFLSNRGLQISNSIMCDFLLTS